MQLISFKSLLATAAALACAAVAAQEQVVKIGHSGPLSGPNTFAGRDNDNGVRLAIEELNARKISVGGKTLKFELVSEDDQCDAKTGVAVAQKFVDSGVRYVMGPYCSGVTIPASRVYDNGGTLVSTVGTNPKITQSGYKNLFRIVASDVQAGASMAAYAANVLKAKKVGVIDDRDIGVGEASGEQCGLYAAQTRGGEQRPALRVCGARQQQPVHNRPRCGGRLAGGDHAVKEHAVCRHEA